MEKHYVVVLEWSHDEACDEGIEVLAVTHTLERAKRIFAEHIAEERQYAEENHWDILVDTDVEFDAAKIGYYIVDHTHLYIVEK